MSRLKACSPFHIGSLFLFESGLIFTESQGKNTSSLPFMKFANTQGIF